MSIWSTHQSDSTTTWSNDDETSTAAWSARPGYAGGSSLLGDFNQTAYNTGTYSSAPAAASGLVGTKYFLTDDNFFAFGNNNDFKLQFASSSNVFKITAGKNSEDVVEFSMGGRMKLKTQSSLTSVSEVGWVTHYDGKLYLSVE